MSLRDKADAVIAVSFLAAGAFMIAAFISAQSFSMYLEDGEVSADFMVTPCIIMGGIFVVVILAFTFPLARVLLSYEDSGARRAAYFSILFPILLVSFLFATPQARFAPSFAFAFPLFVIGTVAYPYSAIVMKRWIKSVEMENLLIVRCFRCSYVFEMHREEPWVRCPHCGQVNMNPTKQMDPDNLPAKG
ncbi:MAG: hypothetical protein GWN18_16065 [Thermoplasmata archaeon]|nr:hydrogenase maturation nickel metallochaperone HypA [Thermoplasmata archaeon]NIS13587.1 hydrogenase maturation nickel metallochaperone HypA [Thermoplasmata archaeon]NIS21456.1 hydrogenase maturation nickel metallochaperone HypA [Thermoplasmata archaeon]NIT79020.1 hydrogenase maturation nickel metallochaperone HypA [Thermoplasmata archaeon]NIU50508.1 hydrogenase maturation nickel metallochaperone HypA [Thermoplasmata archaeon]